jgi:hypothetical protein
MNREEISMKKTVFAMAFVASAFLASQAAYSFSLTKTKVIFSKGPDTWVKITRARKKMRPLDHPHKFTDQQMKSLLDSLMYFQPGFFSVTGKRGKVFDLLTEEEMEIMAAPLVEAFEKADSEQWVDFSVNTFRGQMLIGSFRQTDGVMFVKDGKLNIVIRNIAEKKSPTEELATYDPTIGYRGMSHLEKMPSAELKEDNWLVIDLESFYEADKEERAAQEEKKAEEEEPAREGPEKKQDFSVKERLRMLQELYDEGLITEQEYNMKRKEVLEEL